MEAVALGLFGLCLVYLGWKVRKMHRHLFPKPGPAAAALPAKPKTCQVHLQTSIICVKNALVNCKNNYCVGCCQTHCKCIHWG